MIFCFNLNMSQINQKNSNNSKMPHTPKIEKKLAGNGGFRR